MPIQNLPAFFDMKYTEEDGRLSGDGHLYNDQMFQALNALVILVNNITTTIVNQANQDSPVTINGINPPSLTTAQITALVTPVPPAVNPAIPLGTIWYNNQVQKLQFLAIYPSVVQTITST